MIRRSATRSFTLSLLFSLLTAPAIAASDPALPAVLQKLAAAKSSFSTARKTLPPVVAEQTEQLEIQNFVQYTLDNGALHLFVSPPPRGGNIFAVLVDTRMPAYADFSSLPISTDYHVEHDGPFVAVVPLRPISTEVFDRLKSRTWTEEELEKELGAPSFRSRVFGFNWKRLDWVPQGLAFIGDRKKEGDPYQFQIESDASPTEDDLGFLLPPLSSVTDLTYADMLKRNTSDLARRILEQRQQIESALAQGKPSPDTRSTIGVINFDGLRYADEFVIRKRSGPERRIPAGEHVISYLWLDPKTVVFELSLPVDTRHFYALDTETGKRHEIGTFECSVLPGECIVERGTTPPDTFWFKTKDGAAHEIKVRRK